ncbi:LysR family transcriptional regulator [Herbaspirillum sp.]|uniref:LysR family transcriptional regulator n=1 Tax=Herbaspirillum sp. TaxID=1890675 RepID=UPI001B2AB1B4|nr:LysR family transcriptional regulator [Herbaspirillum sp.]MBO9537820.1 LysR family transcriptional regulator [Herbaspirillum sp.]
MIPSSQTMQNRLRVRQLSLIAALNASKSLRKAAELMHLSQPSATKMLHEIEETLGVTLFERLPRGVQPTVYGQSVIRYAQRILSDLEGLRDELVTREAGGMGEISIGATMASVPGLLSHAILDLKNRFPRLKIKTHLSTSDVLLEQLEKGDVDMVLGNIAVRGDYPNLDFEVLEEEALSIVGGSHSSWRKKRRLQLADLANAGWVLQPPASPIRQLIDKEFEEAGIPTPLNLVETASILVTTTLLQQSEMVAVVPTSIGQHYAKDGILCFLPVRLKFQLAPYGMVTRNERFPAPAMKILKDSLRSFVQSGAQAAPLTGPRSHKKS